MQRALFYISAAGFSQPGAANDVPQKLISLNGRIKNQNGVSLDGFLRILEDNKEYIPKIAPDGSFSAKLTAGTYQIKLDHYRCNIFQITNYRIGPGPKTLDLDVDCQ